MFDIGWGELVVIGIVALIAIGPKELPTVLRAIGHWTGKMRRMASEFQGQFQEAMREAEIADLKKQFDDASNAASSLTNFDPVATTRKELEGAFEGKSPDAPKEVAADTPPAAAGNGPDAAIATASSAEPAVPVAPVDLGLPPPQTPEPVLASDIAAVEPTPPTPTPPPEPKVGEGRA